MARQTLVLDASVGVKWFSDKDEGFISQALDIRESHLSKKLLVAVPDLFYLEVSNAIIQKRHIPVDVVQTAVSAMFSLNFQTIHINSELLTSAVSIARKYSITVYDSCYVAIAKSNNCPLVTANPRHQKPGLGCQVIPIEQWRAN
jgi:predicted nucleic acid-binding protein